MRRDGMERLRYRGPDIDAEGVLVERFEVSPDSIENLRLSMQPGNRACSPGTYARLIVDNILWMSDTDAERKDHITPVIEADRRGGRGLINGLGLGCVLGAWLDVLDHVDVVERDQRIISTIGAWYADKYGDQVTIHHGDAYEIGWPAGLTWSVAWHDIWPDLTEDNLELMARLHRRYGRRVRWQGSWGKELLQYQRHRTRDAWWR